jgi:hypothetical protein
MNKTKAYLIFFSVLVITINCFAQNKDSLPIKKQHNFFLGITVAPNYSWREYPVPIEKSFHNFFSFGSPKDDLPAVGYSALLNTKIIKNRFMFNVGVGVGFYNYKGKSIIDQFPYDYRDMRYKYKHSFFAIHTGCHLLLGKNKLWNIGITADISYIYSLTQNVTLSFYKYDNYEQYRKTENTYDFTRKMFVGWGGLQVGRTINVAQWLMIDLALSCKYSSTIDTEGTTYASGGGYSTKARNLIVSSLNISIYPIFKHK